MGIFGGIQFLCTETLVYISRLWSRKKVVLIVASSQIVSGFDNGPWECMAPSECMTPRARGLGRCSSVNYRMYLLRMIVHSTKKVGCKLIIRVNPVFFANSNSNNACVRGLYIWCKMQPK